MRIDAPAVGRSSPRSVRWPHRKLLWLVVGLVAAGGIAIGVSQAFFAGQQTRSQFMQGILDREVTGPNRLAPGATAYVSGPHGTWVGSAGVANVKTGAPMPVNARMRIESNSRGGSSPARPRGHAELRRQG